MNAYYLLVEEWNYPTESGREPGAATYDSLEEGLDACWETVEGERRNFADATGMDYMPPERCGDGVIITTKGGLDPFYYYVRLVRVEPELVRITEEINAKARREHDTVSGAEMPV